MTRKQKLAASRKEVQRLQRFGHSPGCEAGMNCNLCTAMKRHAALKAGCYDATT